MGPEVDENQVAIWGSSYSGGTVLQVAAMDRRVKAVISQVPFIDGLATFRCVIKADSGIEAIFQQDRYDRAQGKEALTIPVSSADPTEQAAIPDKDAHAFFTRDDPSLPHSTWVNKVTVRTIELLTSHRLGLVVDAIAPTPLLMVIADNDTLVSTDLALLAYSNAREPKEIFLFKGGHFDGYYGQKLEKTIIKEIDFLRRVFLAVE